MAKKIKAKQTEGLVDIATDQDISGVKRFMNAVTMYTADFFEIAGPNELKLSLQKYSGLGGGGITGLHAMHNNKAFLLDMQDLEVSGTVLRMVPLETPTPGSGSKNELGWKRIYPFNSSVTLTSGSNYNINIETNINGWDFSESVHLKSYGNWDITWFAGSVYRSLKSEYSWDSGNALKALELGVHVGGIFLRGGNKGRTITIPANASLIFW